MKSYKDPSFQDRVGRAAEAKRKALDHLRSKLPLDESIIAARRAASLKRDAAETEKRAARKAAEKAVLEAKATAETTAIPAATKAPLTEAQRKLARDARYAARKNRK